MDHTGSDAAGSYDRRAFLRAAAGVGTGALGGAAATGAASAQDSAVTTEGALPADAPTLGNDDYVGMFVHVAGVNQDASTRDVSGCPFVESDDAVVAYDVTVVDRASADTPQADTLMFATVDDDAVEYGKLFIITDQQSCDGDRVQLALDQVGASSISVDTAAAGGSGGGGDAGGTSTGVPGFGGAAALAGLVGAGELLRRRTADED